MGDFLMRLLARSTVMALTLVLLRPALECAMPALSPPMAMSCCQAMGNTCRAHQSEGQWDCCQHPSSLAGSPLLTLPQAPVDGRCALTQLCNIVVLAHASPVLTECTNNSIVDRNHHPPPLPLFVIQSVFRI